MVYGIPDQLVASCSNLDSHEVYRTLPPISAKEKALSAHRPTYSGSSHRQKARVTTSVCSLALIRKACRTALAGPTPARIRMLSAQHSCARVMRAV